ncbi:MAG: ATP-binding protein [Vicinamibacterales bacterium]
MAFLARRVSGMTVLAGAVLALLPALAWLQYSWLDQVAAADRDRRERTLRTAASQLAQEFDAELSRAYVGLQVDGAMLDASSWESYAQRYDQWASAATHPGIVDAVYLVRLPAEDLTPDTPIPILRWDAGARAFEAAPWPASLRDFEGRLREQASNFERRFTGRRGDPGPGTLGDEATIVSPIIQVIPERRPVPGDGLRLAPPDVRIAGFTVVQLDEAVLTGELLPAVVRRHFGDGDGLGDYRVAVVDRSDTSRVIYESDPGAAEAVLSTPDASMDFMSARPNPFLFVRRETRGGDPGAGGTVSVRPGPEGGPGGPPPGGGVVMGVVDGRRGDRGAISRFFNQGEGHWQLAVKHRAGSLEAAVSAARTRNLVLGSGILFLLAAAIGLILQSARRADQLARQQIEFVAAVSHELRTPVAVIGAAAGNLADGLVDDPGRVRTYGSTIQGEARRLGETVERVLQLAGIMSGRAAASPTAIAPATLVHDALAACRREVDQAGVEVHVEVADDLPPVMGDPHALLSAVQNLVSNAVKYGGTARWMRITADAGPGRTAGAREVRVSVEDHGLGIDAADRKRIFDAFFRGREAVARQIQGSGLGLNLVRGIAEAHGGRVTLVSEPGRGSTFTLHLPAATAGADARLADRPAARTDDAGLSPAG